MGGRGSRSMGAQGGAAQARDQLERYARALDEEGGPRNASEARIARTAAGMAGTETANELLGDYSTAVIVQTGADPTKLEDVARGRERPLGISGSDWRRARDAAQSLLDRGYTSDQVAAIVRYENLLRGLMPD